MKYAIKKLDVMEWCRQYDGEPFHALLCDPPYHLTSIVERFGENDAAPAKNGVYNRTAKGFMGKKWDGGDLAFKPETWAAFAEHLYPGAFIFAFASARGYHRMAVAMEDAGLIMHNSIFGWVYNSGFPKGTRIDSQIDKRLGLEPTVIGVGDSCRAGKGVTYKMSMQKPQDTHKIIKPTSDEAKKWEHHRYGQQSIKPAIEPILLFQKPYQGKPLDCILNTGSGSLNIGIRTGADEIGYKTNDDTPTKKGRWPANFYLQHSSECTDNHCVSDCPIRSLNEQSRIRDTAKFFYQVYHQIEESNLVFAEPKASQKERNVGLENHLVQVIDDGRSKSIDNAFQRGETKRKNIHPTVKPINLTKWLAGLLLPPEGVCDERRLMIPFSGSGSEIIGAHLAGWDFVQGIENEQEYIDIAYDRIKYWVNAEMQGELF